MIVVLADVFERIGVRRPPHRKHAGRPGLRVGARIIDGCLILKSVHIRTSKAFGEFQLFRMRSPACIDPKLFIQTDGLHDKRVAIPAARLLSRNRTNDGFAVGASRSGRGRRCVPSATAAAALTGTLSLLPLTS